MDDIKKLTKILKRYAERKLFKDEMDDFKKEFLDTIFEPEEELDYSRRTELFINGVLEEDNLPFYCRKGKEKIIKENLNEDFWYIVNLDLLE